MKIPPSETHPEGENPKHQIAQAIDRVAVDTYDGRVYIDWDHETPVTPLGQLAFFIEFLKRTELFDRWVAACPLQLTSPNAPPLRDIVGTILLSILSGHTRYSHITTVRTDKVNAPLPYVKRFISKQMTEGEWENAGQGWQGSSGQLQLMGWSKSRRVIILRRKIKKEIGVMNKKALSGQSIFQFADMGDDIDAYEYAALVTNMDSEILTIGSHYRDRADSENNFDELKNQWGWSGYTTSDLHRCRLMARIIALIYNWWTLFVRLIEPDSHLEAITSRPLLLHAVGKQIQHTGQKIIQVNSSHGKFKQVQSALSNLSDFFKTLKPCAEQLSVKERMRRVLHRAFKKFIGSLRHDPPKFLPQPS